MAEAETEAFLAFGGNVGDARATLDRAVVSFCDGREVRLLARSADYRTPPWGIADQAPFVNLCVKIATVLSAQALLDRAHAVERAFGRDRTREVRWGPRTVDIDLLTYDDVSLDTPELTLPHPRLLQRAFVLVPLADIAPEHVIAGIRVRDALALLDTAGIERLPRG
jgi:2-amino-4-hydroxy-6-hydroxymethyldihydropteridine diphosphokinase